VSAYQGEEEFEGGVFSPDVPQGRSRARLRVRHQGLSATTTDGHELHLGWRGLRIDRGGASGRVVRCSGPGRRATTFWSEEEGFLRALESLGGNEIADALARLDGVRVSSRRRHFLLWAVLLVLGILFVRGIPVVFRSSVNGLVAGIPPSVDRNIGRAAFDSMDPGGAVIEDAVLQQAVNEILLRLLPEGELFGEPVELRIVALDEVNAFALPGGFLTVYTGLIGAAEGPQELAGVLAHELAHVSLRHGLTRITHSLGTMAALRLIVGDAGGLTGIAKELFTLATVNDYSRDQEAEADAAAVRRLARAGIDPEGLAGFFDRLQRDSGDLPSGLGWIASHPRSAERAERVRALAKEVELEDAPPFDFDWREVRARARR
jgi:hypothetical protein